jgi:hypothetical protein
MDSKGSTRFLIALLAFFVPSCSSDSGSGAEEVCVAGEIDCECNTGLCVVGGICKGNVCVEEGQATSTGGDGDGDSVDGDSGDGDSGDGDGDGDSGDGDSGDGDTGDGDSGDGDGDNCQPNETLCDGICVDTSNAMEHCGMCGHGCDVVDGDGGCTDGVCAPTLSECVATADPLVSCTDVCVGEGKVCVEGACGAILVWYGSLNSCNSFIGSTAGGPCSLPMVPVADYYRCCCGEI